MICRHLKDLLGLPDAFTDPTNGSRFVPGLWNVTRACKFGGFIGVTDPIKETSISAIKALQSLGMKVGMLTGDNAKTAQTVAQKVGVDQFYADVLPQKKAEIVKAMDIAMNTAGVTLVKGDLLGIVRARALSEGTIRNVKQNLFFAFVYNSLGIPLAAGVLYPTFGLF